jgi:hypothetical protein
MEPPSAGGYIETQIIVCTGTQLLHDQLHKVGLNPSFLLDSRSAGQEITGILWEPRVQKSPLLGLLSEPHEFIPHDSSFLRQATSFISMQG